MTRLEKCQAILDTMDNLIDLFEMYLAGERLKILVKYGLSWEETKHLLDKGREMRYTLNRTMDNIIEEVQ